MVTTIKLTEETKERLLGLDLCEKGKSFDMIINDLITYYKKVKEDYKNNVKNWEKSLNKYRRDSLEYDKELKQYEKNKVIYQKLLKWAKSKGFNY